MGVPPLGRLDCGKGCIRFRHPADLPLAVAEKIIRAAVTVAQAEARLMTGNALAGRQRPGILVRMEELLVVMFAGAIVAVLTPTTLAASPRGWWCAVAIVAIVAAAANGGLASLSAREPDNNILVRDIFAWALIAGLTPLLVAVVPRGLIRNAKRVWPRTVVATLLVAVMTAATPLLVLLVHCTSGDCL